MKFIVEILDHGLVKLSPLPARLTLQEVSRMLGIHSDDVSFLTRENELEALGRPERNQEKFFNAEEIYRKSQDAKWLNRITSRIYDLHRRKNSTSPDIRGDFKSRKAA
jgi:hypothetical protein